MMVCPGISESSSDFLLLPLFFMQTSSFLALSYFNHWLVMQEGITVGGPVGMCVEVFKIIGGWSKTRNFSAGQASFQNNVLCSKTQNSLIQPYKWQNELLKIRFLRYTSI